MDTAALLAELLDLAARLEIEGRQESLGGEGGGLCRLRGKRVMFVDTAAPPAEQLDRTAAALAPLPDWQNLYLLPQVREYLESYRKE
jgi:hypothetical protein